jgi:hypothetical protein
VGQHYVQQAFLRHWEEPNKPGWIWTYIRGVDEPRLLPIEEVAQSPGFYDTAVERDLGRLVEGPTTPILDMLRRGEELDVAGRGLVAVYVVTCIKRVPRHRERGLEMLPKQLEEVVARTRADLLVLSGGDPVKLEKLRTATEAAQAKFLAEPPREILDYLRDPRPTREQVEVILRMSWRLLSTDPAEAFLTSDNPLFHFESLGIGQGVSEFAFPLSPTRCLHGSFQPLRGGGTLETRHAERALVHEINRRMANDATKLLFANRKAKFPLTLLRKGRSHYLSRINWTY